MARSHPDWLKGLTKVVYSSPSAQRDNESAGLLSSPGPTTRLHNTLTSDLPLQSRLTFGQQVLAEVRAFFFDTKLNLLLIAFPFAIISKATHWGDAPTFVLSMLALCPLAERLGFITEQLAMYTNETLGGLLNASFGNATEVIISGFALKYGYVRIVQLSLLGSVVSNLLLVMGSAFIAGGIRNSTQRFNIQGVNVNCALLLLGVVAVALPSLLSSTGSEAKAQDSELVLSRLESVLLLLIYGCFLLFQLYTHRFLYDEGAGNENTSDTSSVTNNGPQPRASNRQLVNDGPTTDVERGNFGNNHHRVPSNSNNLLGDEQDVMIAAIPALSPAGLPPGPRLLQRVSSKNRSRTDMEAAELAVRQAGSHSRTSSGRPREGVDASKAISNADLRESLQGHHDELHISTFEIQGGPGSDKREHTSDGGAQPGAGAATTSDDDEEELVLSKVGCFLWLTLVTVIIALLSEWIMDGIKGASKAMGVPMPFLVTILLPIVGNAAEHASAIVFAFKNKIEISLGVAVGSSTQVAVLVVPFTVVLAWMMHIPLDLNFNEFETAVYFISVLIAAVTLQDGTANWLKGVLLIFTYVLVAAGFWLHKDTFLELEDVDAA